MLLVKRIFHTRVRIPAAILHKKEVPLRLTLRAGGNQRGRLLELRLQRLVPGLPMRFRSAK